MKIGIMTMHKVRNFGSALQAYALQHKIKQFGFDNELIDYVYPPKVKTSTSYMNVLGLIRAAIRNAIIGVPRKRQKEKFNIFYKKNFVTSPMMVDMSTIASLPVYDGYITGSDQVWNPRFAGRDTNFMLSFAPEDKPKISYASSFATTEINKEYRKIYAENLSRYDSISVREESGVEIVKKLTGKDASVVCDPTLLLKAAEWDKIAEESDMNINFKYILVYPLTYMYNPYPLIYDIVSMVQKELGYKAVYLEGRKEDAFRPNSKLIKSAGPADFVYLVKHAEFIITTSFHGAVFSMLYNKPMFGLVDKTNTKDSRLQSLLKEFAATDSLIDPRDVKRYSKWELLRLKGDMEAGDKFVKKSIEVLSGMLDIFLQPKCQDK